jgi:hypothetical protein
MNSHEYDPSERVNFSTPCDVASRTSLFGSGVAAVSDRSDGLLVAATLWAPQLAFW